MYADKIVSIALIFGLSLMALIHSGLTQAGPRIEHWQTANGVRVYFTAAPELPMVDVRLVFDAGSARDGERPGIAMLTNALLRAGTDTLSADQVAERFESLGAQYGFGVERDIATLSLRSLSDEKVLTPVLETLALIVGDARFPVDAFARERDRMRIGLRAQLESPEEVAEKAFYRAVYGAHPYASPPAGTEEGLQAITRAEVEAFYKRYYVAANAVLAIVGSVSRSEAERLAEHVVGKLPTGAKAAPLPPVAELTDARELRINHPSTQTHIFIGQPGMTRTDEDYFALYLGNHVLGGSGLVSRLSEEVREKRGLSYSVYSYFLPLQKKGVFLTGLQTRNDQVNEAVRVVNDTTQAFVKTGPEPKLLEASKDNIIGGFPLRIDSNGKIVEYLAVIGFYGLPLDYLNTFSPRIAALTPAVVHDAFRRRVQPERMVTVIVGGEAEAQPAASGAHDSAAIVEGQ